MHMESINRKVIVQIPIKCTTNGEESSDAKSPLKGADFQYF